MLSTMPETKSSGWFGVTRRLIATRTAKGSAASATALEAARWNGWPARSSLRKK